MLEEIIAEVRQAAERSKGNLFTFAGIEDTATVALELLKKAPTDLYVPFVLEALRIWHGSPPKADLNGRAGDAPG